jgi:orotate phosphoribosyltransferase
MSESEKQLLALLKERAFKLGTFRLASGGTSSYYIDGKMVEVFSSSARLIGEVLYEHTKDLDLDAIGGLEVGAVPLTTAAVIGYDLRGRAMEGFWVRDEVKLHGTQKRIEGNLRRGSRVAIVDDVVTKGGSAVKAIDAVRDLGCEVVLVLALVDRLAGAAELFCEHGVTHYRPIFTVRDLGVNIDVRGPAERASVGGRD